MKACATILSLLLLLPFIISNAVGATDEASSADESDTTIVHLDDTILVSGRVITRSRAEFPVAKDRFTEILKDNGFSLIRKGVFLAQDIYADGLKRGDITVVVDGERYHSACPNRMDSPLARVNPLEMESIALTKSTTSPQSGLGGQVSFHRAQPDDHYKLTVGLSQGADASQSTDLAIAANGRNHRINARYATGKGFEDGAGQTFAELYGYSDNHSYTLAEFAATGVRGDWQYRGAFTYTEDVMFPYLLMDERTNKVFSGYASYRDHKLYFNHTDHVMDNGLRVSKMSMVTDARNLTIGLTGGFYDVYYRNWDADNEIITPMAHITNHLMPDIHQAGVSLMGSTRAHGIVYTGKLGLVHHRVGDADRMDFYRRVYSAASRDRFSPVAALSASHKRVLGGQLIGGLQLELASEPPETEYLYITVHRPMTKPWWVGNPKLSSPVRLTARGQLDYCQAHLELFGSRVWNYINMVPRRVGTQNYMTYDNVDALLVGGNLSADWEYVAVNAAYTWARDTNTDSAMAEIPPLSLTTTLRSPDFHGLRAWLRHTYNDAQTRVDDRLDESTTPSWFRVDLGLALVLRGVRASLGVENLTDELYHQHLSYLRNPYSAGVTVNEPGRTVRLSVVWDSAFD